MHEISKLHCITWDGSKYSHIEQVNLLLSAGANWVQLRQKKGAFQEKLSVAKAAAEMCKRAKAVLIINDSPELCKESGAAGVHLGLSDMSVKEARSMLGNNAIIGGTANSPEDVLQRLEEGCDYIGLGPWKNTGTKENLSRILGEEGVKAAINASLGKIPIIVIGGVIPEDLPAIFKLGAAGVAVSSAIVNSDDISREFRRFT